MLILSAENISVIFLFIVSDSKNNEHHMPGQLPTLTFSVCYDSIHDNNTKQQKIKMTLHEWMATISQSKYYIGVFRRKGGPWVDQN